MRSTLLYRTAVALVYLIHMAPGALILGLTVSVHLHVALDLTSGPTPEMFFFWAAYNNPVETISAGVVLVVAGFAALRLIEENLRPSTGRSRAHKRH